MSSLMQTTRSEESFHCSSQFLPAHNVQDTALLPSSAQPMLGSATTVLPRPFNVAYKQIKLHCHSHLTSPIICRIKSPISLFIAQHSVTLAEWIVATVMLGVGQLAARVCEVVASASLQPQAAAAARLKFARLMQRFTYLLNKHWQSPQQSHQINAEVTARQIVHTRLAAKLRTPSQSRTVNHRLQEL